MEGEKEERCEITKNPSKPHFVMIHGLGGGAWSWFKVKCLLDSHGYKATCLDLRGCGIDSTNATTVNSFDHYYQPLDEFMAALPEDEKVILVGYSSGGISVTKALHKFPTKVQLVVYIAATMLKLGFQSPEDFKIGVPDFSEHGVTAENSQATEQPPRTVHFKQESAPRQAQSMHSLEDKTLAAILSRPTPFRALFTTFELEEAESGESYKIPRVYIKTLQDQVLKPEQQEAMIQKWPPSQVYIIDTDHNPLFSSPFVLSGLLVRAAASFT